ncbi:MAG: hypothetical protein H6738_09830 [Alphaproteobacteria bacterium]|nr:hypothetical protein [Alphaproteobacteria bacterium]
MTSRFAQLVRVPDAVSPERLLGLIDDYLDRSPFVPAGENTVHRELVVGRDARGLVVWESPGYLRPPPSVLMVALREAWPDVTFDDEVQRSLGRRPSFEAVLVEHRLQLDPRRQRAAFDRFVQGIAGRIAAPFPLTRRDGKASLRCLSARVTPPTADDLVHRLVLELELAKGPRAKPVVEDVIVGRFAPLGGDGLRLAGEREVCAVHDLDREFANMMRTVLAVAWGTLEQKPVGSLRSPRAIVQGPWA